MERLTRRHADGELFRPVYVIDGRKGYVNETDIIDKLAEYEDLEEQGKLLKLPCKAGDTAYYLDRFCSGSSLDCPSRPCESCEDFKLEIYEGEFKLNDINDFGKTVFLTREEAEAALKELNAESPPLP